MSKLGRTLKIASILLVISILFAGCGADNYEKQLVGSWYEAGDEEALFVFYEDGSCKIRNEYGAGTWAVVNNDRLKVTDFYGQSNTAMIATIEDGCLTLNIDGGTEWKLWNVPNLEESSLSNAETQISNSSDVSENDATTQPDTFTLSSVGEAVSLLYPNFSEYSVGEYIKTGKDTASYCLFDANGNVSCLTDEWIFSGFHNGMCMVRTGTEVIEHKNSGPSRLKINNMMDKDGKIFRPAFLPDDE